MPRPEHLPSPASSTEIKSKDGFHLLSLHTSFELPPRAVADIENNPSITCTEFTSISVCHPATPVSPSMSSREVAKVRRKASGAKTAAKDPFGLLSPPTRSRKIVQMKPRGQPEKDIEALNEQNQPSSPTIPKRKQPSPATTVGRKVARKTAHSIIERRRRWKMNEEFGVLKNMIPACSGEMHKLAILQASIEYVKYLEHCIANLKSENRGTDRGLPPIPTGNAGDSSRRRACDDGMDCTDGKPANKCNVAAQAHQPSSYPAVVSEDSPRPQNSYSSASGDQCHYSPEISKIIDPELTPAVYEYERSSSSPKSPRLLAMRDIDHEVTAALLMLNTDRRGFRNLDGGRGMNVQNLLSTD